MYRSNHCRFVVVSNRLPVVIKKSVDNRYICEPSSGGLITAMMPVLKKNRGTWIGWAGNYEEEDIDISPLLAKASREAGINYQNIDLSVNEYDLYYKGFSNEILWPLFHNLSSYCNFEPSYYDAFQSVNVKFAKQIEKLTTKDDLIWVHDYHLIDTGRELRRLGVPNNIVFFLHIPFPPYDTFSRIPWRRQIIDAMLAYDLLGFQTRNDLNNFISVVTKLIEEASIKVADNITYIITPDGAHRVSVFPISIDFDEFSDLAHSAPVLTMAKDIQNSYENQKIMLGIDRLDYSKGIPQRLKAYEALLERYPNLHTKIKLIQIMVPSREDVVKYASLKSEVEQLVGRINGKFSQAGWIPIQYCYYSLQRSELLAYYQSADIALITPLKDGMNLVAKEYCTANFELDAVLILSEFAGAKEQFYDDALLVNPFDEYTMLETMKKALDMPKVERQQRMRNLRAIVKHHDIYRWVDTFFQALWHEGLIHEINDLPTPSLP